MAISYNIGIDIGGTKTIVAVLAEDGSIDGSSVFPTNPEQGSGYLIDEIAKTAKRLKKTLPIQAVGVGIAGQILPDGSLEFAPNLNWKRVPLKKMVSDTLALPTYVMNDVRAATWGEWNFGAGKGCDDLFCMMIGTGIGGGVIINGQLLEGSNNGAGEVGHFPIQLNGTQCPCGNAGCLETVAAGWAFAKLAREASLEANSAREVLALAERGHEKALIIVENGIQAIVAACIGYVNVFNPLRLLIGGGLGLALPKLVERIELGVKEKAFKVASEKITVAYTSLQQNAVAVGAAAYASSKINQDQAK